jgi:hypothetical protein
MAIPVRQRAIFWLALTLLVWFGFFIAFRREQSEVRWFFFVLFCRAGLRRVSARSLDHQHHALHPARMGPFGGRFLLIGYLMLLWLGPHLIVGAH